MHHFSVVEQAVTKTLLVMDAAKQDRAKIRLRHLIGQRFEDLAEAIKPEGPFGEEGKAAFKALEQYRERHESFRTQLCHGHIVVSVVRAGEWMLVLRTLAIRGRQVDAGLVLLEQSTAMSRLAELSRDARKLAADLGQVRRAVARP